MTKARSVLRRTLSAAYSAIPLKRQVFEILRPLGLPRQLYQHLHFRGYFTVKMDGKPLFQMEADHEILENELFWSGAGGTWEGLSTRLWYKLAKRSAGILDIGANTGAYSLLAGAANQEALIIAFEPVHKTAERLRRNVARNGFEVEVEQCAVSDRTGTAILYDSANKKTNYTASLERDHGENYIQYEVPTVSIDAFLRGRGWPTIDLVKIDVETHEPSVVRGMSETLKRFMPAIFVEVLYPEAGDEIVRCIDGLGYLLFSIDEEGREVIPTQKLRYLHGESWNSLLCTPQQASSLGLAVTSSGPVD